MVPFARDRRLLLNGIGHRGDTDRFTSSGNHGWLGHFGIISKSVSFSSLIFCSTSGINVMGEMCICIPLASDSTARPPSGACSPEKTITGNGHSPPKRRGRSPLLQRGSDKIFDYLIENNLRSYFVCFWKLVYLVCELGAFWRPQGQTNWLHMHYGLHDRVYE